MSGPPTGAAPAAVAPAPTSEQFTAAVTLAPAEAQYFDRAFLATTQPCPWPKAYGGDLVAQAAVAATRTVPGDKTMHSMHSYFLRPADIGADVRYEVELLRDGRGYSSRQVRAYQNGKVIYACLASFATVAGGGSFGSAVPDDIPPPDSLPSAATYLADRSGGTMTPESQAYWSGGRSFDLRHAPGPIYLTVDGGREPFQAVWVRPFDPLREVPGLDDGGRDLAALAYVCDYTILEPSLRVLGHAWADDGLVTASLDHAMWFHRRPAAGQVDGWLLYAQLSLSAEAGRASSLGRFFAADGSHLATVVQEGLIRTG